MQKPGLDKGFQRERDICLHFAHCPQLSNRFVFVFARVRPPRTRRRGARSNLGHCHPRHILGARQQEQQKAAEQLGERRCHKAQETRGWWGRRCGPSSCALGGFGSRALCFPWAKAFKQGQLERKDPSLVFLPPSTSRLRPLLMLPTNR